LLPRGREDCAGALQGRMDKELHLGVALWNGGRFSEAADRFEDVWVGELGVRRECLRGLIHAAMGLHYAAAGDVDAARSKLAMAARLLAPLPADFMGLDLDGLRSEVGALRVRIEAKDIPDGPPVGPSDECFPRLRVLPAGKRDASR
jgi:Domain of unknown function (DUF309)